MEKILKKILSGEDLGYDEARVIFERIFDGALTPTLTSAIISALKIKGETPDEIAAAVSVADEKKIKVNKGELTVFDTCGTGGDGSRTFNISTASAVVLFAMGYNVAKHGNKAITSKVGSYDIVNFIGLPIASSPEAAESMLKRIGFVFLPAFNFHPAFSKVASIRKELKVPTIFNLLGPLINPVDPDAQLIGVYDRTKIRTLAKAAYIAGKRNIIFVSSMDGLDEVSSYDKTVAFMVENSGIKEFEIDPYKIIGKRIPVKRVQSVYEAYEAFNKAVRGEEGYYEIVALNVAYVLFAAGLKDPSEAYKEAVVCIKESIVWEKLKSLGGRYGVSEQSA